MHSLSTLEDVISNGYLGKLQKAMESREQKGKPGGLGSINPPKGLFEPDEKTFRYGLNARGVRERFYNMSFAVLREIAKRVGVVSAIHTVRTMQLKPFGVRSYNDDDVGFRIKLKDPKATPDKKQERDMDEISDFILHSGYNNFDGAEDREEGMTEILDLVSRELLTIDQVAISLQRNRKGDLIAYHVLDSATIKRTMKDVGYMGQKKIKYVQELDSKIIETFTNDDMIFYFMNRVTDIRRRGYGYSFIEMSVDVITGWLYAMTYNKEVFSSNSQPKGIISFEGEKVDSYQLEELQRQWVSMFRGVKGMWKTPFLQYNAKWIPMAPSNRDMEFNQYTQTLASWICAIHGIDAQEFGMRFMQAQNVLNENAESKIAYSKDRGLKYLLIGLSSLFDKLMEKVDKWKDYQFTFTGVESKDQQGALELEEKQTKFLMTVNEKRAEHDLAPIKGGDIILDSVYIQNLGNMEMNEQQATQMGGGAPAEGGEAGTGEEEAGSDDEPALEVDASDAKPEKAPKEKEKETIKKSKDDELFIEVIL